jgi:hypothetical protein
MRVVAVLLPILLVAVAKVPCQRKKPTTRAGNVHSKIVFQDSFMFV